ncbi:MAG: hypothetical protein ACKVX7_17640 [Planctomycetota bacterium]
MALACVLVIFGLAIHERTFTTTHGVEYKLSHRTLRYGLPFAWLESHDVRVKGPLAPASYEPLLARQQTGISISGARLAVAIWSAFVVAIGLLEIWGRRGAWVRQRGAAFGVRSLVVTAIVGLAIGLNGSSHSPSLLAPVIFSAPAFLIVVLTWRTSSCLHALVLGATSCTATLVGFEIHESLRDKEISSGGSGKILASLVIISCIYATPSMLTILIKKLVRRERSKTSLMP